MILTAAILVGGFFIANSGQAATTPSLGTAADFAALGTAVTLTDSTVTGNVGSTGADVTHTGSVDGIIYPGADSAVNTAYADFLSAYNAVAVTSCDGVPLTGTLADVILPPGVYCFDAAATLTGTLTLNGPADGIWIFKIGTLGTGALTGDSFSVAMAGEGQESNVTWWVKNATTMTDSTFKGTILSGADITITRGTLTGRALAKAAVTVTTSNTVTVPTETPETGPVFIDTNTNNTLDEGELFFNTIQDAVDAASSDDTIIATAGNYTEDLIIDESLSLIGVGDDTHVIGSVEATGDNVTIQDLKITNSNPDGPFDWGVKATAGKVLTLESVTIDVLHNGVYMKSVSPTDPTTITINNSSITGYAAVELADPLYDETDENEVVNVNIHDTSLTGTTSYGAGTNDYSTIGMDYINNVTINFTGANTVANEYTEGATSKERLIWFYYANHNSVTGTIPTYTNHPDSTVNDDALFMSSVDYINTVEGQVVARYVIGSAEFETALEEGVTTPIVVGGGYDAFATTKNNTLNAKLIIEANTPVTIIDGTTLTNNGTIIAETGAIFNFASITEDDTSTLYPTIQSAIDAAVEGDTIKVYPGNYNETASGRHISYNPDATYQFGLFVNKNGITIKGVDASGNDITSYSGVLASIKTNATNTFGYSGIFIDADDVTFQGLEVLDNWVGGVHDNAKAIEVVGNNFALKYSKLNNFDGANVYFNDEHFNTELNISYIQSYEVNGNYFPNGGFLRLANGTGFSGDVTNKKILNNVFTNSTLAEYSAISFDGKIVADGSWYFHPVGGATLSGNSFTNYKWSVFARGDYDNTSFDWGYIWNHNTFDKAVVSLSDVPSFAVRPYDFTSGILGGATPITGARSIGTVINDQIASVAQAGDTINVAVGTYNEKNIHINKSLTIVGDPGDTSAGPGVNAPVIDGGSVYGDAFLIDNGVSNVTVEGFEIQNYETDDFDGVGNAISAWVGSTSNITVRDNYFHDLGYNGVLVGNDYSSTPSKWGDHTNWTIKNNIIEKFGYIGFELTNTSNSSIEDNIFHLNTPYIGAIFSSARRSETNLTFKNNQIDGSPSTAYPVIYVYAYDLDMASPILDSVLIEGNSILTVGTPAQIYVRNIGTGTVTGVHIHNNVLSSLKSNTPATIDATNNWWGSAVLATVQSKVNDIAKVTVTPYYITSTTGELGTLSNIKTITAFSIPNQTGSTTINEGAHTINLTMPYGTDVAALVPTITTNTGASVNPNSGVANNFTTNSVTYTITSADETATQAYTVTLTILENTQTAPVTANDGSGTATVNSDTPEVVITNPDQAVTVTVGSGTTNPTIDLNSLVSLVGDVKTGTLPAITIDSSVADVSIPDNTIVTGPSGWDEVIDAPTVGTPSGTPPAGFSVGGTVISIGSSDGTLNFNTAVSIVLPGVTGAVGYRPALSNTWQTIDTQCKSATNHDNINSVSPKECYFHNGGDTIIWTYHFTSFGGLNVVSPGGDNGGSFPSQPATPATPATPKVSPAVPATPATPAVPGKPAPKVLGEKAYANGTLVRGNDKKIFIIANGQKKYISSLKELAKYAGQKIYDVKNMVLIQYPEVLGTKVLANGSLMRGADGKIYVIKNSKKQHVSSLEELRKDYFGKKIYDVSAETLVKY